jgi:Icc-related predicted phosphoesterase
MRVAWLTDLHLNFLRFDDRREFYQDVLATRPDAVLIGGDIAEAPTLVEMLREIEQALRVPVYFVLGNHDFYHSSFEDVQAKLRSMLAFTEPRQFVYLTNSGVQLLTDETALIGDNGWADGRFGDYLNSRVMLNDYFLIREFVGLSASERLRLLNQLADAAAARIAPKLREACNKRSHVVLLTHVPPFLEASWHEGKTSEPEWLPHFASKAMGDTILEVMDEHPECQLLVLCGHTHSSGVAQIRPNVLVKTGAAVYGHPAVQEILDL